jgi:hypothetical protein
MKQITHKNENPSISREKKNQKSQIDEAIPYVKDLGSLPYHG